MPFEAFPNRHIAIIGAGVSGLAAAYELSRHYRVTLFEASPRLGGHARTVLAGRNGNTPVDTGFIVFNYHTYPHLTKMFEALNVPVKKSNMSFGVSVAGGRVEYGLANLRALTAQKSNLARPEYWRMLRDILRFNRKALEVAKSPDMTITQLMDRLNLGAWFRKYYLLPMSGAIWSSTPEQIGDFPAQALVQFFHNHALLTPNTHQWYTVDGGSVEYVTRIAAAIRSRGGVLHTGLPVKSVSRDAAGVTLAFDGREPRRFDQVVFACHSDQALALLSDPSSQERSVLGRVRYQENHAVLHCDESQMPRRKAAWSSWVYRSKADTSDPRIGITYWMNSLQGIDHSDPMFVSLNAAKDIPEEKIYDQTLFQHPVFDLKALQAQAELPQLQGLRNTWFCGAWTRHGFHEDGYASAVAVAERLTTEALAAA